MKKWCGHSTLSQTRRNLHDRLTRTLTVEGLVGLVTVGLTQLMALVARRATDAERTGVASATERWDRQTATVNRVGRPIAKSPILTLVLAGDLDLLDSCGGHRSIMKVCGSARTHCERWQCAKSIVCMYETN